MELFPYYKKSYSNKKQTAISIKQCDLKVKRVSPHETLEQIYTRISQADNPIWGGFDTVYQTSFSFYNWHIHRVLLPFWGVFSYGRRCCTYPYFCSHKNRSETILLSYVYAGACSGPS